MCCLRYTANSRPQVNRANYAVRVALYAAWGLMPGLGTSAAHAEVTSKTYDASLGTFPDAQAFTLSDDGGSPPYTLVEGALHQGPTSFEGYQGWLSDDLPFDFTQGFSMEARVKVISSSYSSGQRRAGFRLFAGDALGRRFILWMASDRIFLLNEGVEGTPDLLFDTTDDFHTYRLVVFGGFSRLFIDGETCWSLTLPLGPTGVTALTWQAAFGDGTIVANSETLLTSFTYDTDPPGSRPGFNGIGDLTGGIFESDARAVSADGSVVVGVSKSAASSPLPGHHEPFRWTETEGMVGLGFLPACGTNNGKVYDLSSDGSIVVGASFSNLLECAPNALEGWRWDTGGMVGLGLPVPSSDTWSAAYGVSEDGSVIVGWTTSLPAPEPFSSWRWQTGVMEDIGDLPGGTTDSRAHGISGDSLTIVGYGHSASGQEACRWTEQEGMVGLGDLPGGTFESSAWRASADGSVVVGYGTSDSGVEAFRWTSEGGMVGLGDLPGGAFESEARAVSEDGSVVLGFANSDLGQEAFHWEI